TRARTTAETSGLMEPLLYSLNNLASLYLQLGSFETSLQISRDALSGPASHANAAMHAKLLVQEAQALLRLKRFSEGEPIYRLAIAQIVDSGDLDAAARSWTTLGSEYIYAGRYVEAELALSEALRLVRTHRLRAS